MSLVEVMVALSILIVLLVGVMSSMMHQAQSLGSQAGLTYGESRARDVLARMEQELAFARTDVPTAWIVGDVGTGAASSVQVDSTLGFPDQGMLLFDRGGLFEERAWYQGFDAPNSRFTELLRGQLCTDASDHLDGTQVRWAPFAEALENQAAPAANQWEGRSLELEGPTFFRGDGTGFSFRVPTDPAGGNQYFAGAEVTWGATVNGTPLATGGCAFYFEPMATVSEAAQNYDCNLDGDRLDVFDLGRLRWRTWDGADGAVRATDVALCGPMILQEQCNWGGDMNNDGFDDPMFLWLPDRSTLRIRLTALIGATGNRPVVRRLDSALFLRNNTSQ